MAKTDYKGAPNKGAFKGPNDYGGVKKQYGAGTGDRGGGKPGGGAPGGYKKNFVKKPAGVPMGKLSSKERREDAAQLWESARSKEILEAGTLEEQVTQVLAKELVTQVLAKVKGKVMELANNHTASRIIQFLIKNGTEAERKLVMVEVQTHMPALAKSKYGHHLGHITELLRHPYGADVLMDLYDVASSSARTSMCAELYGREFVLFSGVATTNDGVALTGGLKQLLETSMTKGLQPVMEKALLHPPMVHRLLKEFLECVPGSALEDSSDTLCQSGANVLKMVHTHDGLVREMATNEWGHAVLCQAVNVIDDTPLVQRQVLSELKAMIDDACADPFAHKAMIDDACADPYAHKAMIDDACADPFAHKAMIDDACADPFAHKVAATAAELQQQQAMIDDACADPYAHKVAATAAEAMIDDAYADPFAHKFACYSC
eukprot:gene23-12835_t